MAGFRPPVGVLFSLLAATQVSCMVLLRESVSLSLPFDYPIGAEFYQTEVFDEIRGQRVEDPLIFHILRTSTFNPESKSGRGLFTVDKRIGALMLSPHRRHILKEYIGSTFALDITASSTVHPGMRSGVSTIVIAVSNDTVVYPDCRPREDLCFLSPENMFQLPETTKNGTRLGNLRPLAYTKACPKIKIEYTIQSDAQLLLIDSSGSITTNAIFDHETSRYHEMNVSCRITSDNEEDTFEGRVGISVLDVNDNAPYVQNPASVQQEFDAGHIIPGKPLSAQLTILDRDSSAVNNITVGVLDPLNLFVLRDSVLFHGVNGTHMLLNAVLVAKSPFHFPGASYNISVIFEDRTLVTDQDNKVVFQIRIFNRSSVNTPKIDHVPEDFQVIASVFRKTSHHARVVQPMEVQHHEGYFFRLSGDPDDPLTGNRIFGVTPATGIVYVHDEVALSRLQEDIISLNLTWRNKQSTDRYCNIVIHVLDSGELSSGCGLLPGRHFQTCALHSTAESCTSSCGRGSIDGYCEWRSHPLTYEPSTHYATCSPDLQTCPDGRCDELEQRDALVCPQDCASTVHGEAFLDTSGRGIGLAAAPCTCDGRGTCTCVREYIKPNRTLVSRSRLKSSGIEAEYKPQTSSGQVAPIYYQDEWSNCDAGCAAMIAAVSLIVTCLVVVASFLVCRQLRNSVDQNYSSSQAPLQSGRSDYTDNSIANAESVQHELLPTTYRCNPALDLKLEFPRENLVLEETLGEGEFGKVVKAKARNIAGFPGFTTVAVKMLKENGSIAEEQDLISELNLLKEVNHQNIIKLMGACTDIGGPLYVIVEFAEHGALRAYLRKLRGSNLELRNNEEESYLVSTSSIMKELLSFAWQIARGMTYLAEMKVVHRDLATRNILLSSGKVIKISDFGLSRDVYEGDTYLKTTKGRVPVKWMALESLEDHIYTTKSDVWSYGIVLWEIITLGGSPYPGISPENLYRLLKEGYRIPKPENCPPKLYRMMVWCWRESPQERPLFKEIQQRLEAILNENSDYLPLREANSLSDINRMQREKLAMEQARLTLPKMSVVACTGESSRLLSTDEVNV